jgi:penicillin-binding protein 1A
MTHVVVRIARNAGIVVLFIVAAMLGVLSGVMFAYAGDLPTVSALDNYSPSTITRVYASSGQVIGEFATQRRVVVGYDDINPMLRNAIIATEDAEFDKHFGINIWRIFAAAATDIIERRRDQGASTLTQQVARNLDHFGLTKQKLFERKVREIILAIQIEKRYTKKENLHDLLQPDVPRPRRLRCRGGVAALFQQIEQAALARRSGARSPASSSRRSGRARSWT